MTADQEAHLDWIKAAFAGAVDVKYRLGAAEHSGDPGGGVLCNLSPARLIEEALGEAVDGVCYLLEARRQMRETEIGKGPATEFTFGMMGES